MTASHNMRRVVPQRLLLAALHLIVTSQLTLVRHLINQFNLERFCSKRKGVAAAVENRTERFALLDRIVQAQITIHPADARDTLLWRGGTNIPLAGTARRNGPLLCVTTTTRVPFQLFETILGV